MAYRREIAIVLLIVVLLTGAWLLLTRVGSSSDRAQTRFVTDAVHNAALTCYAVEGAYPSRLDYLRSHYGLAYDENRYMVNYSWIGSNMMPDIRVTELGVDAS